MDLAVFIGNLPSLVVMAVFLTTTALINNGYLSKLFRRKGKGQTAAEIAERMDKMESDFVPNLGEMLKRIEDKIDNLAGRVSDMEMRLNYVDRAALMAIIYNERIPSIERIRAFVCFLKLGENGVVAEYAVGALVMPNREHWMRAEHECSMKIYCRKELYYKRVAEINNKISQG